MKKIIYIMFLFLCVRMLTLYNAGSFSLKIIDAITLIFAYITIIISLFSRIKNYKQLSIRIPNILIIVYCIYSLLNVFYASNKILAYADFYRLVVSVLAYYVITENLNILNNFSVYVKGIKVWIIGSIFSILYSFYIFYAKGIPQIKTFGMQAINSFQVRFSGLEPDPNIYCMYLIISFIMLVELYKIGKFGKKTFTLLTFLFLVSIVLTFSRSGILMLLIYLFILNNRKGFKIKLKLGIFICIIFSLLLIFNPYNFKEQFINRVNNTVTINSDTDYAIYTRKLYYVTAYKEIKDHIFLGVGRGNFANTGVQNYSLIDGATPQSVFLQVGSELGIIGLILFTSIILVFCYKLYSIKKRYLNNGNKLALIQVCFSCIILVVFTSLFGNFDSTREIWYILALSNSVIYYCKTDTERLKNNVTNLNIEYNKNRYKLIRLKRKS